MTVNQTANLFNSAIAAHVIAAADRLGIFNELCENNRIDLDEFCGSRHLHTKSIIALVHVLEYFDIVSMTEQEYTFIPSAKFEETVRAKGSFVWLQRGYGDFLLQLRILPAIRLTIAKIILAIARASLKRHMTTVRSSSTLNLKKW